MKTQETAAKNESGKEEDGVPPEIREEPAASQTEDGPQKQGAKPENPAKDPAQSKKPGKSRKKAEKAEEPPAEKPKETGDASEQNARELAALKDQYARMLAEYANFKRRTEQEKESIGLYAKSEVMRVLLPVLDAFERAESSPDGPEFRKGIEMTVAQLRDLLHGLGLTEIEAEGKPFDPEIHHAVSREDANGVEPETVTEVFQKGYTVGGRVIRPAMVKVAN